MGNDKAEDEGLALNPGRAKRAPPTIDLQATEVTRPAIDETQTGSEQAKVEPEPGRNQSQADAAASVSAGRVSPWVIAPFAGAVAAALVIGVGWMLGWPAVQAPPAAPQVTMATIDSLGGRLASLEAKVNQPAAPVVDPATTSHLNALEKSLDGLRSDVANLRTQSDERVNSQDDAKSAPHDATAASDLSAINERIARLERGLQEERAELAQQARKIAEAGSTNGSERVAGGRATGNDSLRRVVAAALLDVAVRHGDPYAAQLSAARTLAVDPDKLKPLDAFASLGIPSPAVLCRELLNIVPKLSPPAETQTSGSGIIDRLQAAKLIRIERTDGAAGNDRSAIVSRVMAAALHNDINLARQELKTLSEADREPAKTWLDKADAREAALDASRKFADNAMADLAGPAENKPAD